MKRIVQGQANRIGGRSYMVTKNVTNNCFVGMLCTFLGNELVTWPLSGVLMTLRRPSQPGKYKEVLKYILYIYIYISPAIYIQPGAPWACLFSLTSQLYNIGQLFYAQLSYLLAGNNNVLSHGSN